MTDLIGDIHGHADKLEELLKKLGYNESQGTYSHPDRKVLFVGDYIDRGPEIRKTLQIVKAMVDSGNAIALMGNHEYNALCYHFKDTKGNYLRKHDSKNNIQHQETLSQFQDMQKEYEEYLEWFMTMPLFYETDKFRAVHACWDDSQIQFLRSELENDRLTNDLIYESVKTESNLHHAIETTLKGKELELPDGNKFEDKYGAERTHIRIKWWEDPRNMTYKSISIEANNTLSEDPIEAKKLAPSEFYKKHDKKVFFGHYWLKGNPSLYKDNICCLDYSVADEGKLVAYSLNDEDTLDQGNFIYV